MPLTFKSTNHYPKEKLNVKIDANLFIQAKNKSVCEKSPLFSLLHPILKLINPLRAKLETLRTRNLSDEEYFLYRHQKIFGYTPDFKNPKTFNEK